MSLQIICRGVVFLNFITKKDRLFFLVPFSLVLMIFVWNIEISPASAVSALEETSIFEQPGGETFTGIQKGDEWVNWVEADNGAILVQNGEGHWTYADYEQAQIGKLEPSVYIYLSDSEPEKILENDVWENIQSTIPKPSNVIPFNAITKAPNQIISPQNLLVLLVEFDDQKIRNSDSEWSNLLFGMSGSTVNSYYQEVSGGKFYFTPARENFGNSNDGVVKVQLPYIHPNTGRNTGASNQKNGKRCLDSS